MMAKMWACKRGVIKAKTKQNKTKRECVKEKRERERDITLVSEQHAKNRLKVNIAGLCRVQL